MYFLVRKPFRFLVIAFFDIFPFVLTYSDLKDLPLYAFIWCVLRIRIAGDVGSDASAAINSNRFCLLSIVTEISLRIHPKMNTRLWMISENWMVFDQILLIAALPARNFLIFKHSTP